MPGRFTYWPQPIFTNRTGNIFIRLSLSACVCSDCNLPPACAGRYILHAELLPPASLGQGNIFTSVCQEFCSQGGCLLWGVPAPWGHGGCLLWGVPATGGACSRVGACFWGVPTPGGSPGPHPRGKLRGIRSRPTPKGEI